MTKYGLPDIPSQAQGDIVYHNGTSFNRLAKGTASQVLAMNAGATAPEWVTPSAGGGSTPTLKLTLVDWQNPTYSASGQGVFNASGTSALASYVAAGARLRAGADTTGTASLYLSDSPFSAAAWIKNIYDRTWYLTAIAGLQMLTDFTPNGEIWIGMGNNINTYDTSYKKVGFRVVNASGVQTIYAVTGTGSATTATDITTAINATTGFVTDSQGAKQSFCITYTPTEVKFYCNGTLLATHTTNIPSGAMSSNYSLVTYAIHTGALSGDEATLQIHEISAHVNAY